MLESSLRIISLFDRNYLDELVSPRTLKAGGELTLGDLIHLNSDERIVYDLRPRLHGHFRGCDISTNSLGFRCVERSPAKPSGVFRIVGLGDSVMFGWGVKDSETFLAQLEVALNQQLAPRRFEVWNLAVPGYNTVQEVQTFERRGLLLDPDLVIIQYVDNDIDAPDFLAERPNLWTVRHSFLYSLIRRRRALLRGRDIAPSGLEAIGRAADADREGRVPGELRDQYRALKGWDNMVAAFDRLAEIARQHSIPVVLVVDWNLHDEGLVDRDRELVHHCGSEGYRVVDPANRIGRFLSDHSLKPQALWLRADDPHPNPICHALVANAIADVLDEAHLLVNRR